MVSNVERWLALLFQRCCDDQGLLPSGLNIWRWGERINKVSETVANGNVCSSWKPA